MKFIRVIKSSNDFVVKIYDDVGSLGQDILVKTFKEAKEIALRETAEDSYCQIYKANDKELKNLLFDTYEDMLNLQDENE